MWRTVVRTDPGQKTEFRRSSVWNAAKLDMSAMTFVDPTDPSSGKVAPSFSGGERNRLFMQRDGNFKDVSLVSGVDFRQDGRGFAFFDYDRDGFQDLAVTSPGTPRLRIARNQFGDFDTGNGGNSINILLVGGSHSPTSQLEWSAAEPFGAELVVESGGATRRFQYACSEGLSSQNSKWIHVGLGDQKELETISIFWPSGKTTRMENVSANQWLKIYENPKDKSIDLESN